MSKVKQAMKSAVSMLLVMLLLLSQAAGNVMDVSAAATDAQGYADIKSAQQGGKELSSGGILKAIGNLKDDDAVTDYMRANYLTTYGLYTLTVEDKSGKVTNTGKLTKKTRTQIKDNDKDKNGNMVYGDVATAMQPADANERYVLGDAAYEGNSASDFKGVSVRYKLNRTYPIIVDGVPYAGDDDDIVYIQGVINEVKLSTSNTPLAGTLKHAISFRSNEAGIYVVGIDSISITWSFYTNSACTKSKSIKGYFLNTDIDAQQGVSYGSNVEKIFYTNAVTKNSTEYSTDGKSFPALYQSTLDGRTYIFSPGAVDTHRDKPNLNETGVICGFSGTQVTSNWTFAKAMVYDDKGHINGNTGNGYMSLQGDVNYEDFDPEPSTGSAIITKGIYNGSKADFENMMLYGTGQPQPADGWLPYNQNYIARHYSNADAGSGWGKGTGGYQSHPDATSVNVTYDPAVGSSEFTYIVHGHYDADSLKVNADGTLTAGTRMNLYDTIPSYLMFNGQASVYVAKGNTKDMANQTNAKFTVKYDTINAKSHNGTAWVAEGADAPNTQGYYSTQISAKYGGNDTVNGSDYTAVCMSEGMDVYLVIPVRYKSEAELGGGSIIDCTYVDGAGFLQTNKGKHSYNLRMNDDSDEEGKVLSNEVYAYANYSAIINIKKTDDKGNALAGAQFPLFCWNNILGNYCFTGNYLTTDANGYASMAVSPSSTNPGCWYAFVEQTVPTGFSISPVYDGAEIQFLNGSGTTSYGYRKYTDYSVSPADVGFYLSGDQIVLNDPKAVIGTETVAPTLGSTNVNTWCFGFNNMPKKFNIKVRKAAAEDTTQSLAGFKFKLKAAGADGEIELTDNKDGTYTAKDVPLNKFTTTPAANWQVYEAEATDNRELDPVATDSESTERWVKSFAVDLNGADGQTIIFDYGSGAANYQGPVNKAKRSTVKVKKTDNETGEAVQGATYAIVAQKDIVISDYAGGSKAAVMDYDVTAPCDLYGADASLIHKKGDSITASGTVITAGTVMGYIKTDEKGEGTLADVTVIYNNGKKDTVKPLFAGSYYAVEADPAEGYLLSDKQYPFTVQANKVETVNVDTENTPVKPGISVSKLADKTVVAVNSKNIASGDAVSGDDTSGDSTSQNNVSLVSGDAAFDLTTGKYNGTKLTKTYAAGETALYTINVTNTGNVPLTNVNVRDYLDERFADNIVESGFVVTENGTYTTALGNAAIVTVKGKESDASGDAVVQQAAAAAQSGQTQAAQAKAVDEGGNTSNSTDNTASGETGSNSWLAENDIYTPVDAEELKLTEKSITLTGDSAKAFEGAEFDQYAIHEDNTSKRYLIGKAEVKDGKLTYKTSPAYCGYIFTCNDEINGYDMTDFYLLIDAGTGQAALSWESENVSNENIVFADDKLDLPSIAAGKNVVTQYMKNPAEVVIDRLAVGDSINLQFMVSFKDTSDDVYDNLYNNVKAYGEYSDNYKTKLVQDKSFEILKLVDPKVAVSKLAGRTTGAVWNPVTGRYDGEKQPAQYVAGETVDFRIDATNTGNVLLYNTRITDKASPELLEYMMDGMKFDLSKSALYTYDASGNAVTPDTSATTMTSNNTEVSLASGDAGGNAGGSTADGDNTTGGDNTADNASGDAKDRTGSPVTIVVNGKPLTRGQDYSLKTSKEVIDTIVSNSASGDVSGDVSAGGGAAIPVEYMVYTITGKNDYDGGVSVYVADGKIALVQTTNTEVGGGSTNDGTNSGSTAGNGNNSSNTANPVALNTKNTTVSVKDNKVTVKCEKKKLLEAEDYTIQGRLKNEDGKVTATYTILGINKYSGGVEVSLTGSVIDSYMNYNAYVPAEEPKVPEAIETAVLTTKYGYNVTVYLLDNYTVVADKLRPGDSVALCLTGVTRTDVSNTSLLENVVEITSTYLKDDVYTSITGDPDNDSIYMIHPSVTPAKEADRTTGVTFNPATGQFDGEKISGTYAAGETITWSLYATNTGDCQLYNIHLTDTQSPELLAVLEENSGKYNFESGAVLKTNAGKDVTAVINEDNSVTFDTLDPHDYIVIKYSATVKTKIDKSEGLANTVDVTAQYLVNGQPVEIPGPPDTDKVNVVVPGVAVAKLANKTTGAKFNSKTGLYEGKKETGTYKVGEKVDFTITVTNTMQATLYNIKVTDTMDKKLSEALTKTGFVKKKEIKTHLGNTAKVTYKDNTATIKKLEPGDYVKLHYTGVTKKYLSGKLNNTAKVKAQYKVNDKLVDIDGNKDSDSILIEEPPFSSPKDRADTGDYFNFGTLVLLLGGAGGCIGGVVFYRRRKMKMFDKINKFK